MGGWHSERPSLENSEDGGRCGGAEWGGGQKCNANDAIPENEASLKDTEHDIYTQRLFNCCFTQISNQPITRQILGGDDLLKFKRSIMSMVTKGSMALSARRAGRSIFEKLLLLV